ELDKRSDCGQVRITDVDMASDESGPLGDFPADHLSGPLLDPSDGQARLALGPNLDGFKERPGLVMARVAHTKHAVQVDVGIDERRGEEPAFSVDNPGLARQGDGERPRRDKAADSIALDHEVVRLLAMLRRRVK